MEKEKKVYLFYVIPHYPPSTRSRPTLLALSPIPSRGRSLLPIFFNPDTINSSFPFSTSRCAEEYWLNCVWMCECVVYMRVWCVYGCLCVCVCACVGAMSLSPSTPLPFVPLSFLQPLPSSLPPPALSSPSPMVMWVSVR